MVDAKMTVSAIAVGPAADAELLTNIAKWGKGRSYVVLDAKEVPQIFVKEAKNAMNPSFDEKPLKPVVKTQRLSGRRRRRRAHRRSRAARPSWSRTMRSELLATEDGDPLLAFWPIGLGRTAVFASDVKDRWASRLAALEGLRAVLHVGGARDCAPARGGCGCRGACRRRARIGAAGDGDHRGARRARQLSRSPEAGGDGARRRRPHGRRRLRARSHPGAMKRGVADAAQPLTVTVDGGEAIRPRGSCCRTRRPSIGSARPTRRALRRSRRPPAAV